MTYGEFIEKIFDDVTVKMKNEGLGKSLVFSYDIPEYIAKNLAIDDIRESLEDDFQDTLKYSDYLLRYDAYDYKSGGLAKEQLWYDNLTLEQKEEKLIVKLNTTTYCTLVFEDDDCWEIEDITQERFDEIAEIEASRANIDNDDDEEDDEEYNYISNKAVEEMWAEDYSSVDEFWDAQL